MSSILTGKDIISALIELKKPANFNEILEHLATNANTSKTVLLEEAKVIIDAGVRFGSIEEEDKLYCIKHNELADVVNEKASTPDKVESLPGSKEMEAINIRYMKPQMAKTKPRKPSYTSSVSSIDDIDEQNDNEFDSTRSRSRSRSKSRRSKPRRSHPRRSRRRRRRIT